MNLKKLAAAAALAFGALGSAQAVPVALELALVIDISGSVDAAEYVRQRDGYKAAFQDAGIGSAIASFAGSGGVAVGVYYFADGVIQTVGWTQLMTAVDAANFGTTMGAVARPASNLDTSIDPTTGAEGAANSGPFVGTATNVAGGLNAAVWGLGHNAFEGARRVIDISGDGKQNVLLNGTNVACGAEDTAACNLIIDTAQAAVPNDIVVNGLAIEGQYGANGLTTWYNAHIKNNGGFVVTAANFDAFESAVVTKIGREITGNVPEPTSLALVGLALCGLGLRARRRA